MKPRPDLTMRYWLDCRRSGVDLFNLNERTLLDAWDLSGVHSLESFTQALRWFLCGDVSESSAEKEEPAAGDEPRRRLTDSDVFAVCALVPGWLDLPWFLVVELATARRRLIAQERALLLATVHNVHCHRKSDLRKPADFNEFVISKRVSGRDALRKKYGYRARTIEDLAQELTKQ